jgi:hypothetical protein
MTDADPCQRIEIWTMDGPSYSGTIRPTPERAVDPSWDLVATAPNGSLTNMAFGGRDWLIQRNWVNASGGFCAKSF